MNSMCPFKVTKFSRDSHPAMNRKLIKCRDVSNFKINLFPLDFIESCNKTSSQEKEVLKLQIFTFFVALQLRISRL